MNADGAGVKALVSSAKASAPTTLGHGVAPIGSAPAPAPSDHNPTSARPGRGGGRVAHVNEREPADPYPHRAAGERYLKATDPMTTNDAPISADDERMAVRTGTPLDMPPKRKPRKVTR